MGDQSRVLGCWEKYVTRSSRRALDQIIFSRTADQPFSPKGTAWHFNAAPRGLPTENVQTHVIEFDHFKRIPLHIVTREIMKFMKANPTVAAYAPLPVINVNMQPPELLGYGRTLASDSPSLSPGTQTQCPASSCWPVYNPPPPGFYASSITHPFPY